MNSDGGPLHNGIQYCGIVPYLGIFLSDFTFLDEGSQTFSSPGALPSPPPSVFAPTGVQSLRQLNRSFLLQGSSI